MLSAHPDEDLYAEQILKLAEQAKNISRLNDPSLTVTKNSKLCGSTIVVDVQLSNNKLIAYGHEIDACALGMASATLVSRHCLGQSLLELQKFYDEFNLFLKSEKQLSPAWQMFHIFANFQPYSARHSSILLALAAVVEAMSMKEA